MAKKTKKRRSAAQRAATAKLLAFNKKRRGGKSKKRTVAKAAPAKRAAKRVRRAKRAKSRRTRVVFTEKGKPTSVKVFAVRKRRRKTRSGRTVKGFPKAKSYRKRRGGKVVRTNPAMSLDGLMAPLREFGANLKASTRSPKGIAVLVGGAVGSVVAGTFVRRIVVDSVSKVAPNFAAGPIGSRLLPFLSYYLAGWAIARFAPISPSAKRAVLAGAVVAGTLEAIKPNMVLDLIQRVPVIGPIIAGQVASVVGEYTVGEYAMGEYDDGAYMGDYEDTAGQTLLGEGGNTWGDPDDIDGLGCGSAIDGELVSYSDDV